MGADEPGVEHVLSAWVKRAKGEQGEANITFTVAPVAKKFHVVTKLDGGEAKTAVPLADDEWHFVELPFVSECGDCKIILDGQGAATVVEMADGTGMLDPVKPKEVYLDRPFIYMLIDCEANIPLFIGVMNDPEK